MCIVPGSGGLIATPDQLVRGIDIPELGILIFTEYMAEAVGELADVDAELRPSNKPYRIKYDGVELGLIYPFYGAPATIFALELAIASGLRRFIAVGEAGSIHPEVGIGDYVLPDWGVREEGTSYHYMPPDYVPRVDNKVFRGLRERLDGRGLKYHVGGVWSTDAVFRETVDKVRRYSSQGVLCVDMESTALMAVSEYHGVEMAILLVISDELHSGRWVRGWGSGLLKEAEYMAVEICLETIVSGLD